MSLNQLVPCKPYETNDTLNLGTLKYIGPCRIGLVWITFQIAATGEEKEII